MLMSVHAAIFVFGLAMPPMFEAGLVGAILAMTIGMSLVGLAYGPLGTVLSELFPRPCVTPAARLPSTWLVSLVRHWPLMPQRGWQPRTASQPSAIISQDRRS